MDIENLHYVEFKMRPKNYMYIFICTAKGILFTRYIKFTAISHDPNVTWSKIQMLMQQYNLFIHDFDETGRIDLGEIKVRMDFFSAYDLEKYGKHLEHWSELAARARVLQKEEFDKVRERRIKREQGMN